MRAAAIGGDYRVVRRTCNSSFQCSELHSVAERVSRRCALSQGELHSADASGSRVLHAVERLVSVGADAHAPCALRSVAFRFRLRVVGAGAAAVWKEDEGEREREREEREEVPYMKDGC